jgi:acetyltransferase-like isoleucine patch superfamily enzyme
MSRYIQTLKQQYKQKRFFHRMVFTLDLFLFLLRFVFFKLRGGKGKFPIFLSGVVYDSAPCLQINGIVRFGRGVKIKGSSTNTSVFNSNVVIGDHSIIFLSSGITSPGQGIRIGENTTCGEYCIFGAAGGIDIGKNVLMGQFVRLHAENHVFESKEIPIREQGVTRKGIRIEDDVWLGAGSVILDGVTVRSGCIIGANSVVTKDTEAGGIYAGQPARLIKFR